MYQFDELYERARAFRDARDWMQFHNPKDLAISISLEASELLEVFQWSGTDLRVSSKREHTTEELAGTFIYCLYMADALGIDPLEAIARKLEKNEKRYPIAKSHGTAKKYNEL